MAGFSESEIQSATTMLENARKSGRIVTAKQMTPAAQEAQRRLLAQPKKTNGAFKDADAELIRRQQGIGGKGMVK